MVGIVLSEIRLRENLVLIKRFRRVRLLINDQIITIRDPTFVNGYIKALEWTLEKELKPQNFK